MKYNIIFKSPEDKAGIYDKDKICDFVIGLGWNLVPVQGYDNKFWIVSKFVDGKRCELMSGSRYYKLEVNDKDFGIESGGDFNGWGMAGEIRQEIKDAREAA